MHAVVDLVAKIMQGDAVTVSEQDVLAAIRAWLAHDESARRSALAKLLPCVRFPTMSDEAQLEQAVAAKAAAQQQPPEKRARRGTAQLKEAPGLNAGAEQAPPRRSALARRSWRPPGSS